MSLTRLPRSLSRLLPLNLSLGLCLSLGLAGASQAQSLLDLYESAKGYDAGFQSARSQYEANLAKVDQAKAALLPSVGFNAGATRSMFDVSPANALSHRGYITQSAGVSATQPLYRPANLATYLQGQQTLALAEAALSVAQQDLIVRVSQAYFDVLTAEQSLVFVKAQKAAVAEQLASAKRNFEVGTATITDTREAQARFDLVTAQEIAADNDLRVKKVALELLVGKPQAAPLGMKADAKLPALPAEGVDDWIRRSDEAHPGVVQARANLEVAKLETEKAVAGHKPTVDLTVGYNVQRNLDGTATSLIAAGSNRVTISSAGVNLTVPIFAGTATQNRIRETVALEDKARSDLESAQRNVAQATRTAYLGLQSGLGQVMALEAAESSSQIALDANKLGYQVGVRINIDVLNSQSQLFQTKRDLAKARFDVLMGQLKLRQAAGLLKAEDLQPINALLQP